MHRDLVSRIRHEIEANDWHPESRDKLARFVAKYSRDNPDRPLEAPFAVFDADNTTWTGDLGDASFAFLARRLGLSPRLHEVLPASIPVRGAGFGVPGGQLFAAARVEEAMGAMLDAYRARVAPFARVEDFLGAFSETLIQPGGALCDDDRFMNAYRVYTGVIVGAYNLLDALNGSVSFDFAAAEVVTSLYGEAIPGFYGWEISEGGKDLTRFARAGEGGACDILFPEILDAGPDQRSLRAAGKLGAYSQAATWISLDRTPADLRRVALEVWSRYTDVDAKMDVVFPVDAEGARSPAPLDFAANPSRFQPGASPGEGVIFGATSLSYGTRVRPEIVNLMDVLGRHGITPVVVTASQVDLVRGVLDAVYGFREHPLMGMHHAEEGGVYRPILLAPVTYRPGKVHAVREVARRLTGSEDARPVLTAGDSNTDLEFVAYSSDYRLFFDRGKRPFMDLGRYLAAHGAEAATILQQPFAVPPRKSPA